MSAPRLAVACWKLVELRAGVDPLTGAVLADPASAGPSPADEAALEWALRIGDASGCTVAVVSAGGSSCEAMLRRGLAAGADRAVRVALEDDEPSDVVAAALAAAIVSPAPDAAASSARGGVVVCCGDASLDRGSGAVPAFLAAELDGAQALGLLSLTVPPGSADGGDGTWRLEAVRRLGGGGRERLRLEAPCVLSFEAASARLRRAPLGRLLEASTTGVDVVGWVPDEDTAGRRPELLGVSPFGPRTRVVPPPPGALTARERIDVLTGAGRDGTAARTLELAPEEAAGELLATLAGWGELPEGLRRALAAEGTPATSVRTSDETEPS